MSNTTTRLSANFLYLFRTVFKVGFAVTHNYDLKFAAFICGSAAAAFVSWHSSFSAEQGELAVALQRSREN